MSEKRLSFTFEKCLGLGGFGEVYVATMAQPGGPARRVAVKVLKADLQNTPEAVQRLRDEGRMLGVLDHPSIVRGLEMTVIAGRIALVTEYLEGLDLARCTKPATLLPPRVVLQAIARVASALHKAIHTPSPETGKPLQLIHRDIKPDNLRIGSYGEVKVLDFGIARTTEMYRHAKTAQGSLPFTPGYAPPEAFTQGFQGASSDIFALGVTLFRLLTAKKFFEGLDLTGQVQICCLPDRYDPFLEQRLKEVEGREAQSLLRDMLRYEPTERPKADEVEERCTALSLELPGTDLEPWARAMDFPPPKTYEGGSLTGQTLQEDPFKTASKQRINPREERKRAMHKRDALPTASHSPSLAPLPPVTSAKPVETPPSAPAPTPVEPVVSGKVTLDALFDNAPPSSAPKGPPRVPQQVAAKSLTPAPAVRFEPKKRTKKVEEPAPGARTTQLLLGLIALLVGGSLIVLVACTVLVVLLLTMS